MFNQEPDVGIKWR